MQLLIYAAYTVLGLGTLWGLYLAYLHLAARPVIGRPADPLYRHLPELATTPGRALVYCHSPRCRPCRTMSREVDTLRATGAALYKLDITRVPQTSRELGVRATPTLILIEDGRIARLVIGARSAQYMARLLTGPAD